MVSKLLTVVLCVLTTFAAVSAEPSHDDKTLVFAATEYPPFTGESLSQQGFMSHVVSTVFTNLGYQVKFEFMPWSRALQETEKGHYHGAVYGVDDAARNDKFLLSDNIRLRDISLFVNDNVDIQRWDNFEQLLPLKLGITRGYHYDAKLFDFLQDNNIRLSTVNSDIQNMKMLALGRIDAFMIQYDVGQYLIQFECFDYCKDKIRVVDSELVQNSTHVLFSRSKPGNAALAEQFNQGLMQLKQSQYFAQMQSDLSNGHYYPLTITSF